MFIPAAEQSGAIISIENWILKRAFKQLKEWIGKNLPSTFKRLSINITPSQFNRVDFFDHFMRALNESGVDANRIELEITEGMLVNNMAASVENIKKLQSEGVRFSIDDFGTGYSSLSYLQSLPLQKLKIDQSFVNDIYIDSNSAAIVEAIISMASALDLEVIAEGVETYNQLSVLKKMGCTLYQGYYFSKPISAKAMWRLLQNNPYPKIMLERPLRINY